VARRLRAAGRGVTSFAVREALGGGNYRRIQAVIDELTQKWKSPPPAPLPPELNGFAKQLREEVAAAFDRCTAQLWQQAVSAADARVIAIQQELDRARAAQTQEREQAFAELDRLTRELEHEREAVAARDRKLDEATQQRQTAEQAAAEIRGELKAVRRVLEQRERELEEARAQAARLGGALQAEQALRLAAGDTVGETSGRTTAG
jgi:colicin import membrane protein